MRRTMIVALVVLVLAVGVIAAGSAAMGAAVARTGALIERAASAVRWGTGAEAARAIGTLAEDWRGRMRRLEAMTAHDALYDVRSGIEEAALYNALGDRLECLRALQGAGAALERIRVGEAIRLMNLF